ncbi:MAG: glycosyltransferase [bacterium]|nr:glycosyltransferase [bacterium]
MKSATQREEIGEHFQNPEPKETSKPVFLVLSDFYLPGYKSGGGMRTLVNMVDRFGDDYDFWIVTRDHDGKTDKRPYAGVQPNTWVQVRKSRVRYLTKDRIRISEIKRLIQEVAPDCLLLNSYFSTLTVFALLLRRFGSFKGMRIVIAPEGELTDGGLELKKAKKRTFLKFASAIDLYADVVWRTNSPIEKEEVARFKGTGGKIFVAPNMPPTALLPYFEASLKRSKKVGRVRLVYLSRIHPKKNLIFLLELLKDMPGDIQLDVFGPIDAGERYLERCTEMIGLLPANVRVTLKGGLEHSKVLETLLEHDFFVLPTLSENFGHVFIEALAAGCPILISDQTPWLNLETRGVGWDIPLADRDRWIEVLRKCVQMDAQEYSTLSGNARSFAVAWITSGEVERANREVFRHVLRDRERQGV